MKILPGLLLAALMPAAVAGPLSRSAEVLREENKLTITYFGGSITNGAGASDKDKTSYRLLVTRWFREKFPKAQIEEINAAHDGTGTWQGSYRVGLQVAERKPDLVFVEFAVNDNKKDLTDISRSMEGIVRHIWRENPRADIVFLYTAMTDFESAYEAGGLPSSAAEHEKIARHYGITSINVGGKLWKKIKAEGKTWKDFLPDTVHPNDAGYADYARTIGDFLAAQDWSAGSKETVVLPVPLNAHPHEFRRMIDAWTIDGPGWQREETPGVLRFPHCLTATEPGTELVYKFQGTMIGLYIMQSGDGGDFEWSVDGSPPKRESTWHKDRVNRPGPAIMILKSLPPGEHEFRLKVLPDKAPDSTGTAVRIGAIFLNQPPDSQ